MPQSNDIAVFDFFPLWDLSTIPPVVSITNNSQGSNLAGCTFWFEVSSGGGPVFHQGLETAPDITGAWTTFNIAEAIPQVLGHVEWSGSLFKVKGFVKDSSGVILSVEKNIRICRPFGNKPSHASNFGTGSVYVETKCERARLYVEDKTDYTYNGNSGNLLSKVIKLIYPPDLTGTVQAPAVYSGVNNALIPISRSANGYIIVMDAVYQYTFEDGSRLKLKYKFQKTFEIQCGIDLCPLICDIHRLREHYNKNGCSSEEREKMIMINSLLTEALMAKMQPMCGVSVAAIVDEIKQLGGFTCDCSGDEFSGINALIPTGGNVDCNAVLACVTSIFHQADPGCGYDHNAWQAADLLTMVQYILDHVSVDCKCSAPADVTYDSTTNKLRWRTTNTSYQWKVEYRKASDSNLFVLNTSLPNFIGSNFWEMDVPDDLFQNGVAYIFYVTAICGTNNHSTSTPSPEYIINGCTPVTFDTVTSIPNAIVGVAYTQTRTLSGTGPFTISGSPTKPAWMTISIVGNLLKLTGTPSSGDIGTNITVSVGVSNGCGFESLNVGFSVTALCIPVSFTDPTFPDAQSGQPYLQTILLTGSAPFNLSGPDYPSWVTVQVIGSTLQINGTPGPTDVTANIGIKVKVNNACGDQYLNQEIAVTKPTCVAATFTVPAFANALANQPYSVNIVLSGTPPFYLTGTTKPGWMTIQVIGSTLQINGTPGIGDTSGSVPFGTTVHNDCGVQALTANIQVNATCVAASFTTPTLPDAMDGVAYVYDLTLTGSLPFNLTGVTKPAWMTLAVVGNILQFRGTPATPDITSSTFVAYTVSNACGSKQASQNIQVLASCTQVLLTGPSLEIPDANNGDPYSVIWTITGTSPYSLLDIVKPAWMTVAIVGGTTLRLTGTPGPGDVGTDIQVSFTIQNSCSSESVSNNIDVTTSA